MLYTQYLVEGTQNVSLQFEAWVSFVALAADFFDVNLWFR